jgi:WD40 repeat protein
LAIDPITHSPDSEYFLLVSASSDPEVRRWHISLKPGDVYELSEYIVPHETSIYALRFDEPPPGEEAYGPFDDYKCNIWTASADKTAKHLVRIRGWEADTVLQHSDFVRDVIFSPATGLVVTACRDEEVRVWDSSSGELVCTYSGHFEEVTGLALVEGGRKVVSVSIDGTVRVWSLERGAMAKYLEEVEREKKGESEETKAAGGSMLTAEEEAELAELMEDDED